MDESAKCFLRQLVRRIQPQSLKRTLQNWRRLTLAQKQCIDLASNRELKETLFAICEENRCTVKQITELEMLHVIENPNLGTWHAFELQDPDEDSQFVDLMQFKEQFKSHLSDLTRHVSIKIKKHTDEAVWIRIVWGDSSFRPNNFKPTYVVHQLQTPYFFVTALTTKHKHLLLQACILATKHGAIKDCNLSGRRLLALRDLLMKKYQQAFPSKIPIPLGEENQTILKPYLKNEQVNPALGRRRLACEAFGAGTLPQIESVMYKLETKFKDQTNKNMTEREQPFKCVVKFGSTNLLESLRHCASTGIASTPVTPLLSSITSKGRNYFVVTDNGTGPSSQGGQPLN